MFCVIQAASAGRLQSLPKSGLLMFNKKKVTQDVIFAKKVLKTK
jgi:hypothetical protein